MGGGQVLLQQSYSGCNIHPNFHYPLSVIAVSIAHFIFENDKNVAGQASHKISFIGVMKLCKSPSRELVHLNSLS